jgi:small-conductance mechanosensitive channel
MTTAVLFALQLPAAAERESATTLWEYVDPNKIAAVLLIVALTAVSIHYLCRLLDLLGSKSSRARFVVRWAQPAVRIFLWFAALMICFALLAPTAETFLTGLASIGLAFGLGAQDLVKNLLGGLIILGDRPFQLGDRVRIGEAYGEIDYIGLHSTKLTTPDDTRVTIPNASVATSQIYNSNSGVPDSQVVTDLYLPPTTDPQLALRIGYQAAHTSPYLLVDKPVVALVSDVLDQRPYLRLRIKAYVYDHRFEPRMQSDITVRAKSEFLRLGLLDGWRGAGDETQSASDVA